MNTHFAWSNFSLAELRANATRTFREGGGSRPDVLLIKIDGNLAILKDQNQADKLFATLIGPILNWRECKALERLDHLACVPKLLAKPDSRSFLMTYHESEQVTRLENTSVEWPLFFAELETAIDQVHTAGVAHNDLRNPTNILVTPKGKPVLVDLVACFCRGQSWNLPNIWLFNKFSQVDRSAITKLKNKVAPDLIEAGDVQPHEIAGRSGMAARRLGQLIRKISRKLFTK